MKSTLYLFISFVLFGCATEEDVVPSTANSPIVGTWTRYEFYQVEIQQNGTVCQNGGVTSSGIEITFNADGTYSGSSWGSGTWTYDATSGIVTRTSSGSTSTSEVIYYNVPQIPWSPLTTPSGTQNPTLYVSYDLSLGSANGGCQYYMYTQQRMSKN